ncbi:Phosphatidylinositol 4-kinase LSB6 [Lithohypha guttulata]|uniref:Phosphatidylinositol 4-kinase LSB6 n=1 Tax=Lithohypha guttulata TaxID=1690604 RepID=UPI002DE0919A|nr:Phosphatidylinositol 4-kinase LSB6 [Lithohypha guttulata]KAK5097053.1 Phosphatidylinositol 4-kinase LSB6 [Lithohypha guttulata]
MPRNRPATSGYAKLAQADEDEGRLSAEHSEEEYDVSTPLSTRYESIIPPGPRDGMRSIASRSRSRPRRRMRSNSSGIDIKAINARLEQWADEIASKFKISSVKGKSDKEEQLEIHHSVFQAPDGVRPYTSKQLAALPPADEGPDRCNRQHFDEIVESVRVAIELGMHPKMITQGSSGSYFARNSEGKVVGVFKPKDEEPYASRNPKWTKWIHRNLFPCFFGRACLIPNLSYVSEAAAYVLDMQLRTNIVPHTQVVWLSSRSFYYDFWERGGFWRRNKPLPAKPGSFQVFLKGYKDATMFLKEHPWPDQNNADFRPDIVDKKKRRPLSNCLPNAALSEDEEEPHRVPSPAPQEHTPKFAWTPTLKQAFREELEKLVILDYIMRNTDRGLDNWMIKIDWQTQDVSIVAEPPKPQARDEYGDSLMPAPRPVSASPRPESNTSRPYRRYEAMESRSSTPLSNAAPTIRLGAIDNSLSWPWKHPDAWRSFPFGWLFLPVSLIGQPFSQKTRDHFLPLLTSTAWWSETQLALRKVFSQDDDFKESMFARQIAVMKGQAWNVVETLKQTDHGPLELTRRTRVCVWDDMVDIPVAVPMRMSSEFMRMPNKKQVQRDRHNHGHVDGEEEMDIGISSAPSRPQHTSTQAFDLLGSPTTELPNPNRFELTREGSDGDIDGRPSNEDLDDAGPVSPVLSSHTLDFAGRDRERTEATQNLSNSITLPSRPGKPAKSDLNFKQTRFSLDFPRHKFSRSTSHQQPQSPSSTRRHRSNSTRTASGGRHKGYDEYDYEDDAAGDLGYAAANDMEGRTRKVIVERLEAVKSRNPVFTWC